MGSSIDNYRDTDAEDYNIKQAEIDLAEFEKLSIDELVINIWMNNANQEHLLKCSICQMYSSFSIAALKGKWQNDWGDVNYFIEKVKQKGNVKYIDIGQYTSERKHEIIDFIKKYSTKN